MNRINIIITVAIAAVTISIWAWINRPDTEPPWPAVIEGFSFSPMRPITILWTENCPPWRRSNRTLALLEGKTHAVRTYTLEGSAGRDPALAGKHGINVALGA